MHRWEILGPFTGAPEPTAAGFTLEEAIRAAEERAIHSALLHAGGNREKAAHRLGVSPATLYRKLARLTAGGEASRNLESLSTPSALITESPCTSAVHEGKRLTRIAGSPFGLCPEKADEGSVCLDFFISQRWVGPFKGDGRDFEANAAPEQSRIQLVASAEGEITFEHVSKSCRPKCFAPDSRNSIKSTPGADGGFTITVVGYNSALRAASPIDTSVTFTPDGRGGFSVSGDRRAMPNLGIYQRSGGAWQMLDERPAGFGGFLRLLPFTPRDRW